MWKPRTIIVVVAAAVVSFLAGTWYNQRSPSGTSAPSGRRILYYACPMHPQYTSDRPGDAPCCGMRLEPVYADSTGKPFPPDSTGGSLPPGTVRVSAERQQLLGVRVGPVERLSGAHTIRTTGRVAADENRLYRLNASTEMWIRRIYPPTTGTLVRKDEPLCAYYATNFLSAAQSYLYALDTWDRQRAARMDNQAQIDIVKVQIRSAVESLQNLGVSDTQIAEMERTRKAGPLVDVRSPTDGFVLSRTATLGQWIGPGTEMYQIADLSHVWIFADLFENEARRVRPGLAVKVSVPNQELSFTAKVSDVPPLFDAAVRTMKVRLEADNPRLVLWPGMFVDVEFPINLPPAIAVPVDAVIDSGLRKTVYVERGGGYFEPRIVRTGWRFGDRIEVTEGLEPGERIVMAGNFLLDSESRMKAAAAGIQAPAKDPVCGMDVDQLKAKAAGWTSEHQGKTYYFCCEDCKKQFDKHPERYLKKSGTGSHSAEDSQARGSQS